MKVKFVISNIETGRNFERTVEITAMNAKVLREQLGISVGDTVVPTVFVGEPTTTMFVKDENDFHFVIDANTE